MKKRNIVPIILAVVSAGMAVLAYFVLPETVVIQFSMGSSGNSTTPKLLAILIPTALGVGGAVTALIAKDNATSFRKGLILSGVGIALCIFMIAVNTVGF